MYFHDPQDLSLVLPHLPPAPTVFARTDAGVAQIVAEIPSTPGARIHELLTLYHPSSTRFWTARTTEGWLAEGGGPSLDMPDLSGAPGWDPSWSPTGCTGGTTPWWHRTGAPGTRSRPLGDEPPRADLDGFAFTRATRSGEIQP